MTYAEMRDVKMGDLLDRGNFLEVEIRKIQEIYLEAAKVEYRDLKSELELIRYTMHSRVLEPKGIGK